jgi:hypothetical protein
MFDRFNDGYCPQCLLAGDRREMILNCEDLWECPACRLQMHGSGMAIVLHPIRGVGQLKDTKACKIISGRILLRCKGSDPMKDGDRIENEHDLRQFLTEVTDPLV